MPSGAAILRYSSSDDASRAKQLHTGTGVTASVIYGLRVVLVTDLVHQQLDERYWALQVHSRRIVDRGPT